MSSNRRALSLAISAIALVLLLAVQVRFNSGAFLLIILVIGPLFASRAEGTS